MSKLLKPASFGFYILVAITFFLFGLYVANMLEVGKGQMMAAAVIVLGWGVMFAGIALILSVIVARYLPFKWIVRMNWILLVIIFVGYGITILRAQQKRKVKEDLQLENRELPPKVTEPTALLTLVLTKPKLVPTKFSGERKAMGMGYFSPNYYEHPTLYFYGTLTPGKSLMEHRPVDSIVFRRNKYNSFEIATAPPWFVPEMMKLDYDLLYVKIKSVSRETVEVIVNEADQRTALVDKLAGRVILWPEFLLNVHSVEFFPDSKEQVHNRPFRASGVNHVSYDFMRPLKIQEDWMEVELWNQDFESVGKGWIQWKHDGQLMILYNLLS